MNTFETTLNHYHKNLELYVPVVDRVHGASHPEFHEVKQLFDAMNEKLKSENRKSLNLEEDFKALRDITSNYSVPGDVCESYEAVYTMLAELDKAYHQQ